MADTNTKTVLDLITASLRKIGVLASNETPSASEANDGLDALNGMLDLLSLESLSVYNNVETVFTLVPGKSAYSIGLTGDIAIERPLRLTNSYTRITTGGGSVDWPCEVWSNDQYADIGLKGQPGPWPKMLYYNTNYPNAEIRFWPVPSQGGEFHLWTEAVFANQGLSSLLNLPRGYYQFLLYRLAEVLSTDYGIQCPPDVVRLAKQYTKAIKSLNATPKTPADIDGAIVSVGGSDAGFVLHGGF